MKSKRPNTLGFFGVGYLVALLVTLALAVLALFGQGVNPILPLVLFVVAVAALAFADLRASLFLALPTYALSGAVVSNVLIERGEYVAEQFRFGFEIGATTLLALYSLGFLAVAHVSVRAAASYWQGRLSPPSQATLMLLSRYVLLVLGIVLALRMILIFQFGMSGNRFEFRDSLPEFWSLVFSVTGRINDPLAVCVGLLLGLLASRKYRTVLVVAFFVFEVPLLLVGEKFSPFIAVAMGLLAGLSISMIVSGRQFRFRFSQVVWTVFGFGVLLAFYIIGTLRFYGQAHVDVVDSVFGRVTLQGHVWFGILDLVKNSGSQIVGWSEILPRSEPNAPSGLDALSLLVSVDSYVLARLEQGITFTLGGPAVPLAIFGMFWGLIVYSALAVAYGIQAWVIFSTIAKRQYLLLVVAIVFSVTLVSVLLMGFWHSLYSGASILFYLSLLVTSLTKMPNERTPSSSSSSDNDDSSSSCANNFSEIPVDTATNINATETG